MSNRQRLTWKNKGAAEKEASPAPQVPANDRTEDSDHPAAQEDAAYDKYKSGDPSAWAEDVHPGPYDTSPAPATPGMQEPADHPAAKPGKPMSASDVRKAAEKKAAKCIRVATSMIGDAANFETEAEHTAAIEDQALDLMDLPDEQLSATLSRLGMDDAEEEESDKEASVDKMAAFESKLAAVDEKLDRILKAMNLFSMPMEEDMMMDDDDMMVDDMMDDDMGDGLTADDMMDEMMADAHGREMNDAEYGYMAEDDMDAEAKLEEMLAGRGMMAADDEDQDEEADEDSNKEAGKIPPQFLENVKKKKEEAKDDDKEDKKASDDEEEEEEADKEASASEEEIVLAADQDPMGLMDATPAGDTNVLDQLYRLAGEDCDDDDGDDEEEEEVEVEMEEKEGGKKKASTKLRPQPKKASKGVQSVGQVSKTASSDVSDLSSLWSHAPDVSDVFNS